MSMSIFPVPTASPSIGALPARIISSGLTTDFPLVIFLQEISMKNALNACKEAYLQVL